MKKSKSLRFKLFFWYVVSLALLALFIILTVHIYQYKYSTYILTGLFLILSLIGYITIFKITKSLTDLTSQIRQISSKNLEKRIPVVKRDDEIGELSLTFNEMLDRLDKAFKRERLFIADVAHEMKTPITTLRSSFEVTLHKPRTNEEYKKIINDSIAETDRITNTLKNILELAWTEVPNDAHKESFNLSDMMSELIEIAQKLASKKQISIIFSIASNIQMKGFKDRLGRAVLNIIDNAIKYTPHNGRINISLVKEYTNALIIIKDNGQGIEQSEIEHIFDRFYRGSKTDKVFGAGLGMAIAKATVGIHGGVIQVKSKPKIGSTFSIALPLS